MLKNILASVLLLILITLCAQSVYFDPSPASEAVELTETETLDIEEAIFRYAATQGHQGEIYLARGRNDPPQQLLNRLKDLAPRVLPISQSNLADSSAPVANGIANRKTQKPGILWNIGQIHGTAKVVDVDLTQDMCTGSGAAFGKCILKKIDGKWRVVEWKPTIFS